MNNNTNVQTSDTLSAASSSENHNNQTLHTTRTYVQSEDTYSVDNSTSGNVMNNTDVSAYTGGNKSRGGRGSRGSLGGSVASSVSGVSSSTIPSSNTGGTGGDGGFGGNGGAIDTGSTDSLSSVVTTTGRTVTRLIRH
jgi:hypothetical protein